MTFPESSMANYLKQEKSTVWLKLPSYADTRERFWKKQVQTQSEVFTDVTLLGFPLYLTG